MRHPDLFCIDSCTSALAGHLEIDFHRPLLPEGEIEGHNDSCTYDVCRLSAAQHRDGDPRIPPTQFGLGLSQDGASALSSQYDLEGGQGGKVWPY